MERFIGPPIGPLLRTYMHGIHYMPYKGGFVDVVKLPGTVRAVWTRR